MRRIRKRRTRPLGPLVASGFLHNIYVTPEFSAFVQWNRQDVADGRQAPDTVGPL